MEENYTPKKRSLYKKNYFCLFANIVILKMTLLDLKNKFYSELSETYPKTEITSFFSILVEESLSLDKAELILNRNKLVKPDEILFFNTALFRLKRNEPIQYIIGFTEFYNLKLKVNKDVLIPRPETEELTDWIVYDFKNHKEKIKILDIGTGSGAIAISLAKNLENSEVWAIDVSDKALQTAKENALINKVNIHFIKDDILQVKKLPTFFDVIVSNPPYVRDLEKKEMQNNVLLHEPNQALYVRDNNPLIFYDKIAKLAKDFLSNNGSLYFEINQYLKKETVKLVKDKGFSVLELRQDFLSNNRMLKAKIKE